MVPAENAVRWYTADGAVPDVSVPVSVTQPAPQRSAAQPRHGGFRRGNSLRGQVRTRPVSWEVSEESPTAAGMAADSGQL